MNFPSQAPPGDDADLHALVDGRLPPAAAQRLLARLDERAQDDVRAWEHQRALLQGLHGDWRERPLPTGLRQAAERLQQTRATRDRWTTWGALAAGWVLAFGLGWTMRGYGDWPPPGQDQQIAMAGPLRFARQAVVAHAVYQPEQRHPVEVTADQQEHLVQWLSRRLARPLTVPYLQDQGYELMGGRLLPGGRGARAQLMYQDATGRRITLYLGAMDEGRDAQATAFQFHREGPVSSFYWMDQGFGYALSGELSRPALLALATTVYQQLHPAALPAGEREPASGS